MNTQTSIKPPDYTGRRGDLLSKALRLLSMKADQLEGYGHSQETTRNFIRTAANEAWPS